MKTIIIIGLVIASVYAWYTFWRFLVFLNEYEEIHRARLELNVNKWFSRREMNRFILCLWWLILPLLVLLPMALVYILYL